MGNTSDEIKIINDEIKKTKKAIRKALEGYNEVFCEGSGRLKEYNAIPPDPLGAYKETAKILVDAMLGYNKDLNAHRHTIKDLQSRLHTLNQSREVKLNKIVHKEDDDRSDGMTYQEDREKTTFISPLPILTSPYLDYPELIDYIQDFETLGRKKHLLFINDADGKAEDLALDMAFQIDGKYPYKGEGRQPKIPQVMTGLKAVGGKPMVTMEDAYKKFHFIGRCIVLFDIRRESYDSLKVSFPCLSKTEIVVFAFLKPGDDLNSLPPAFLHYCKIFDLRKRQFVERVCMERSQGTASEPQTPAGATVNNTPLCFTYNKQSLTLTLTNNHGNPMKLSKQKAKLFNLLKKPKGIRLILKKLYSKQIEKNQKIADSKRNSYDSFASKFNEDWRDHFELNEELKLIQCDNEIVSIVQRIDWK